MTGDEFEAAYAQRSQTTVEELHALGRYAVRCDCGHAGCEGWGMGRTSIPTALTPPPSPKTGQIYHDAVTNKLYYYDGSSWNYTAGGVAVTVVARCSRCGGPGLSPTGRDICYFCEPEERSEAIAELVEMARSLED